MHTIAAVPIAAKAAPTEPTNVGVALATIGIPIKPELKENEQKQTQKN